MAQNLFRFTLSHVSGSKVISEPEGWNRIKMTLERDKEFHSLIELIETPFLFYGSNGVHDGGKDYLKNINSVYGVDAQVTITIEISRDEGVSYENLFVGLIDMQSLKDIDSRKVEVVIMPDDLWSKFKNRFETPVIITQADTIDGGTVSVGDVITLNMTSQTVRQLSSFDQKTFYDYGFNDYVTDPDYNIELHEYDAADDRYYISIDWDHEILNELPTKYNLGLGEFEKKPPEIYIFEYGGIYEIEVELFFTAKYRPSLAVGFYTTNRLKYDALEFGSGTPGSFLDVFIKIGDSAEVAFTKTGITSANPDQIIDGLDGYVKYSFLDTVTVPAGTTVQIYAKNNGPGNLGAGNNGAFVNIAQLVLLGQDNSGIQWPYSPTGGPLTFYGTDTNSFIRITGDTTYDETQGESFYTHDVAYKITERVLNKPTPFYSEYLGSGKTIGSYPEDGCGWAFVLIRGLQIRQYSLSDKPFSMSFKQWWDGMNPIHNLGLGYDIISSVPVIRVEDKAYFYNDSPSIYLNFVNNVVEGYDKNYIFKKIKTGFSKWESEDISGLDDPQTRHDYATLFKIAGIEINLLSDFIAASIAFEVTRRKTIKKSADYKYDNETFIVSVDPSGPVGEATPLTSDNFDTVTNLLHPGTRYNLYLTPARNLLRWLNFLTGCLQKDLTSSIKFMGGEGNYDMESEYNPFIYGNCFNIYDGNLSEKQDIDLPTFAPLIDYLFQPITYEFKHPLSYDQYKTIRQNRHRAIAVSKTDSGHDICFIQKLEYDLINSLGTFTVWKK